MKYLLDTCAFLWFIEGNTLLSETALAVMDDPVNDGAVSVVSIWELSMKSVTGKLSLPMSPADLEHLAFEEGLDVLPLVVSPVERFHQLPIIHRDAFDRLLAAIALTGNYTILTSDTAFDTLGVPRIW